MTGPSGEAERSGAARAGTLNLNSRLFCPSRGHKSRGFWSTLEKDPHPTTCVVLKKITALTAKNAIAPFGALGRYCCYLLKDNSSNDIKSQNPFLGFLIITAVVFLKTSHVAGVWANLAPKIPNSAPWAQNRDSASILDRNPEKKSSGRDPFLAQNLRFPPQKNESKMTPFLAHFGPKKRYSVSSFRTKMLKDAFFKKVSFLIIFWLWN